MGDVGEGPGVDKHWCALQQLEGCMNMLEAFQRANFQKKKGLKSSFMAQLSGSKKHPGQPLKAESLRLPGSLSQEGEGTRAKA